MAGLSEAKRIVIKVGTSTLTHKTGLLNIRRIERLVKVISDIKNSGKEIILVSSGAVGVGVGELGLKQKPSDVPSKQACAAVGQCELMYIYDKNFLQYNHRIAQILLTRDIIEDDKRKQNVRNAFDKLLEYGVIPIVNENDTVSTEELELEFGDNDTLSAIVASLVGADMLVILSDIDGLYDKDPKKHPDAKLISRVSEIDDNIKRLAGGEGSAFSTGGMKTKLNAAEIAFKNGFPMILLNGFDTKKLYDLYDGKIVGTLFKADNK